MKRFERFLALLHYNSLFNHSGIFAMFLDGNESQFRVSNIDEKLEHEVEAIGNVGCDIEIASNGKYVGKFVDKDNQCDYYTGPAANLYKGNEIVKTIPAENWSASEKIVIKD